MRNSTRFILATTLAAGLVGAALPSPASAAPFTLDQQKCRSGIAKAAGALAKAAIGVQTGCHKLRDKTASMTNCNNIAAADAAKLKFSMAEGKFGPAVTKACPSGTPSSVLFDACPAPCAAAVPSITTFAHVSSCLDCLIQDNVQGLGDDAFGLPTSPLSNAADLKCHAAITKAGGVLYNAVVKAVAKCQAGLEKTGTTTIDNCTDTGFAVLVEKAHQKAIDTVHKACGTVTLPSTTLDACNAATTLFELENCVANTARDKAQEAVTDMLALPVTVVTTSTTSTTLPSGDPGCPDVGELTLLSKMSNLPCTSDLNCKAPRKCNLTTLRCETVTDLDSGWTGIAQNSDVDDQTTTRAKLLCPGSPGSCGECTVQGIDPSLGNCRCANNTRIICDKPFASDATNCSGLGGDTCDCYFGAPIPLNSSGTHVCLVNRFAQDITGTANVDAGSGAVTAKLRTKVYTGILDRAPCPICGGKCTVDSVACLYNADCTSGVCVQDTPGDGHRDGKCIGQGSPSENDTCDITATNPSFPSVPGASAGSGGGGYSLDCMPSNGASIAGQGLAITLSQTTGTQSVAATLPCSGVPGDPELCPCLLCSGDPSVPCSSDAECASQGGSCSGVASPHPIACNSGADCASANLGKCGTVLTHKCQFDWDHSCTTNTDCQNVNIGSCNLSTCSVALGGYEPHRNGCVGGACEDAGNGEGLCSAAGPDDHFCDGLVRADGSGMKSCTTDASCGVNGTCTVVTRRPCFLDPIVSTGHADPANPVAGGVFCLGSVSSGVNPVAGLPGPARSVGQGTAKTFCASSHAVQYTPGVGGCPP